MSKKITKEVTTMINTQGTTQLSNITVDDEEVKTYDAYDFGLAAALLTVGHEILFMHELEDCIRVVFHFIYAPNIHQDENAYWNGKLQVDPQSYFYELNNLQARLEGVLHGKD